MKYLVEDIERIIDYSRAFAEDLLVKEGEYYPFGVTIDSAGKLKPWAYTDLKNANIQSQHVIEELTTFLSHQLATGAIRCYGITYNVQVTLEAKHIDSEAIALEIGHTEDREIPVHYFPYRWTNGELTFDDSFTLRK